MFRAIFNFSKTLYQKVNDNILLEIAEMNVRYLVISFEFQITSFIFKTNIGSRKARKQGVFEEWLDVLKDLTIMGFRSGCNVILHLTRINFSKIIRSLVLFLPNYSNCGEDFSNKSGLIKI